MSEVEELKLEVKRLTAALATADRQLSGYRLESSQANDYIRKIGVLLGCSDGDDTPEMRIAEMKKDSERLDWLRKHWPQYVAIAEKAIAAARAQQPKGTTDSQREEKP